MPRPRQKPPPGKKYLRENNDASCGRFDLCRCGFDMCIRGNLVADRDLCRGPRPTDLSPGTSGRGPRSSCACRATTPTCHCQGRLHQPQRARYCPHRRDRHYGRTGVWLRAFQAARFPARQGSGADLRRRSLGDHAVGAEDAGPTNAPPVSSSRSASTRPIIRRSSSRSMRPATPSAPIPGRTPPSPTRS